MTSPDPASATRTRFDGERFTTIGVVSAVVALFAFYGVYLARVLVPLPPELAMEEAATAYGAILVAWRAVAGSSLLAMRVLSLLFSALAIMLTFRVGRRLTQDPVVAAFFTLAFVLFPPLVAAFSTATPHALIVLLALGALELILSAPGQSLSAAIIPIGTAAVLGCIGVVMAPVGPLLMPLWLLWCGAASGRWAFAFPAVALTTITAVISVLAGGQTSPVDSDLTAIGQNTLTTALLMPYGMIIVATLLSAIASFSPLVRQAIGRDRLAAVLLGPFIGTGMLLVCVAFGWLNIGQLVTAASTVLPFALFASWPLIVWVRRVMPHVKSLAAWIVFPVVMYSCFWVILGPIDPGKYPYSHRQIVQPQVPSGRS
ncbi:MAG: hypothetical protein EXR11_00315 [Rhodospirillaceae bacterium]|nr:hypothetical protein [Rhodospirillaceae bacterium]